MQINTALNGYDQTFAASNNKSSTFSTKDKSIDELKQMSAKGISTAYFMEFSQQSFSIASNNTGAQSSLMDILSGASEKGKEFISSMALLSGYSGKDISTMDQNELKDLVSEDGFFGIKQTSERIANFVISGAGDDVNKLQKGFEGMKRGFEEASKLWGGKLPDISNQTIDKAIQKVASRIEELGANALNINA
ncbi:hypothetical protein FFA43_01610 [Campylobacter hyointestinalis subsp. hyointestinalis]|uniref:Hydrogenase-4 component G n=1 Tax=Campylobacter hyointestinalis subsp. hyointestinalis TaxID=91352 RepID=A0A9W5AVR6_CAMHY|nr:hypothetical protein [Campylobacter hyointestinalis]PPB57532.1 hypothetical protein CDQ71_06555 [Campylobacter hyointestinalis subsp. hyointestinalis]QCT99408.1 hypothetical protein FFA43_01610 [Campylobacter hyointestinalis subsp. hyointestinalis]CUU83124.1 hydrogenase-4 component G [Campylobacter hyointestinalis subsp. hyointestinalis]CUU86836.1 hydrogenase-4 component G [Campylobacter hyointestinalis subsp. hyointestinalis]CUU90936.1 hydrogenase-4 component G [Campylobacter hyointestinal